MRMIEALEATRGARRLRVVEMGSNVVYATDP